VEAHIDKMILKFGPMKDQENKRIDLIALHTGQNENQSCMSHTPKTKK
jgi:hypothetical protein